jgi:hypothetical protein
MATGANNQVAGLMNTLGQGLQQLQAMGLNPNAAGGGGAAAPAAGGTPAAGGQAAAGAQAGVAQPTFIPGTGKPEIRVGADGKTRYYAAAPVGTNAPEITAFQYTESHQFKINLDYREGIATGLANLSRIFGARQERVRLLSNALANDANNTGSFNPVDLQKMSLETTTTQQLSEMQKKIFDSMRDSIQAWLR